MESMSRSRRAQVFAVELLIALAVLFILLVLFTPRFQDTLMPGDSRTLEGRAYRAADLLTLSPGLPEEWNSTNVTRPGLVWRPFSFNDTKVAWLSALDNETLRQQLGIAPYSYSLTLTTAGLLLRVDNVNLQSLTSLGLCTQIPLLNIITCGNVTKGVALRPLSSADRVIVINRYGTLAGNTSAGVNMSLVVWR